MNRKKLYPGVADAEKERNRAARQPLRIYTEDDADIIHTASGYCPNYAKFDAMGWSTEKALVWCNLD